MKSSTSLLSLIGLFLTLLACESDLTTLDVDASDYEPKIHVTGYVASDGAVLNINRSIPVGSQNFSLGDFHLGGSSTLAELMDDTGNSYLLTYRPRRKQFVYHGEIPFDATYSLSVSSDGLPTVRSHGLRFAGNGNLAEQFSCTFDTTDLRTDFSTAGVEIVVEAPEERYYGAFSLVEDPDENAFARNHLIVAERDELVMSQCGWFVNEGIFVAANTCFTDTTPIVDYGLRLSNFYIDTLDYGTTEVFNFPLRIGTVFGAISEADYQYVRSLRRNEDFIDEYFLPPPTPNISNVDGGYGYVMMLNGSSCWIEID